MSAESSVRIVPTADFHIPGLHAALDEVAKERRYLAFLGAPPLAATREFSRALTSGAGVQLVAVTEDERVVGWCDIVRVPMEGSTTPAGSAWDCWRRTAAAASAAAWPRPRSPRRGRRE